MKETNKGVLNSCGGCSFFKTLSIKGVRGECSKWGITDISDTSSACIFAIASSVFLSDDNEEDDLK